MYRNPGYNHLGVGSNEISELYVIFPNFDQFKACFGHKTHPAFLQNFYNYHQVYISDEWNVLYFYRKSKLRSSKSLKSSKIIKGKSSREAGLFEGPCKVRYEKGRVENS